MSLLHSAPLASASRRHALISWTVTDGVGFAIVRSGKSGRLYVVTSEKGQPDTCTCEAGNYLHGCSHVRTVRDELLAASRGDEAAPAPKVVPLPARPSSSSPLDRIDAIKARVKSGAGLRCFEDMALLVERLEEVEGAWARLRDSWFEHANSCPAVAEERAEGERVFDRIKRIDARKGA